MNLSFLTADDWQEFQERFPDAEAFLVERSNRGRLRWLRSKKLSGQQLTKCQASDLATLEYIEQMERTNWLNRIHHRLTRSYLVGAGLIGTPGAIAIVDARLRLERDELKRMKEAL